MASTPLTLAALATSAVPNLKAVAARKHSLSGDGDFTAVVVATEHDEVIVRVPMTDSANAQLSADILGQNALSRGIRERLSFAIPEVLGVTRAGESRAVVSTYIAGDKFLASDLVADALLVASIAACLDSFHCLPSQFVQNAGLPTASSEQVRANTARLVDRANATGLLPVSVRDYWYKHLEDQALWDFTTTPIHGSLDADKLIVQDDAVVGILGFGQLQVGDPAADFAWLDAAPDGVLEETVRRYSERTQMSQDTLIERARLYHELELAKWLLHGVEKHDQLIIDDAIEMLDSLVDRVSMPLQARTTLATSESVATEVLTHTPNLPENTKLGSAEPLGVSGEDLSELDDDRVFRFDTDFIEPLPAAESEKSSDPKTD